jgi:hypothetical protein
MRIVGAGMYFVLHTTPLIKSPPCSFVTCTHNAFLPHPHSLTCESIQLIESEALHNRLRIERWKEEVLAHPVEWRRLFPVLSRARSICMNPIRVAGEEGDGGKWICLGSHCTHNKCDERHLPWVSRQLRVRGATLATPSVLENCDLRLHREVACPHHDSQPLRISFVLFAGGSVSSRR